VYVKLKQFYEMKGNIMMQLISVTSSIQIW